MPVIPILEVEAVRLALETMRQAESLGIAHPLTRFISLHPIDTPRSIAALDTIIFRRLANLIRRRLNQHRNFYGLPAVKPHVDSADAKQDFQFGNTELEAWSVLYYRYVRVDLDLSLDQLEALTRQDRRTLHRRQSKGMSRLTHDLTRRELRARTRQRQIALRTQLPLPFAPQLVGRSELMASALTWLVAPDPPRHLMLYGAPGVGKSALALALAHQLIEQQIVQNVVWISYSPILSEQIAVRLGISSELDGNLDSRAMLSTYLQRVDTLVVIDDAQPLVEDVQAWNTVLRTLGAARLLICAATPGAPDPLDVPCIRVPDLDKAAALDLLAREVARSHRTISEEHISRIYDELGGNPRGLRLALSAGRHYSPQPISAELYGAVWAKASLAAQLLWLILALCPSRCAESELQRMLAEEADAAEALDDLSRLSVIEVESEQPEVILFPLARAYAETVLQDETQYAVSRRAVEITHDGLMAQPDAAACLHLLDRMQRAFMPAALRLDLAYSFAPIVEHAGAWLQWRSYLESLRDETSGADRLWIGLHLGLTYRWLTQWDDATYLLSAVIEDAGRVGAFDMQARAMTELAVVHRLQRRTDVVAELLDRAESYYRRHQDKDGIEQITSEYVQMALDMGNARLAQEYLDRMGQDLSPRLLNLAALTALRADDPLRALDFAQVAQNELSEDLPRLGRTLALIGQIHYRLGNWATAVNYLVYALALMEEQHDLLGHARTRLNLSAIYLSRGNLRAALRYLHGLPAELERLGDVVSLEAALNNLRMLNEVSSRWSGRARGA